MMIYPLTKVLPKHNQDKNQQIVTPQLEILPQAMSVKQFFFLMEHTKTTISHF